MVAPVAICTITHVFTFAGLTQAKREILDQKPVCHTPNTGGTCSRQG